MLNHVKPQCLTFPMGQRQGPPRAPALAARPAPQRVAANASLRAQVARRCMQPMQPMQQPNGRLRGRRHKASSEAGGSTEP